MLTDDGIAFFFTKEKHLENKLQLGIFISF